MFDAPLELVLNLVQFCREAHLPVFCEAIRTAIKELKSRMAGTFSDS
jgi:hypothetical protein